MNTCLYTDKDCEHADESGECKQGQQNCCWKNWEATNDYYAELNEYEVL